MTTISENVKIGQNVKIANPIGPGPSPTGSPVPSTASSNTGMILGIVIGSVCAIIIGIMIYKRMKHPKKKLIK